MFGTNEEKFDRLDHKEDLKTVMAVIKTSKGDIEIELYADKAPMAVWNFVNLAEGRQDNIKKGPFYNGIIFHRVIKGFMVQAGCPNGMGTGGPGYEFDNEIHPELRHDQAGVMAMANRGPDTNGSQFYITLAPTPHLDGGYTVFGKVVKGLDVVMSIGDVETSPYNDKPVEDIVINSVEILRD